MLVADDDAPVHPFAEALAALGADPDARGGVLTRYDIATEKVRAVAAWKVGGGFSLGMEFTWDKKAHAAGGELGLEWKF